MSTFTPEPAPAEAALLAAGLEYRLLRHRPAASLTEAAQLRGLAPRDLIKSLVVRLGIDRYQFVLVPGDRELAWPKLRAVLGVNRISMPDADAAYEATGYRRGTITPFGSRTAWPVIADQRMQGREISLGSGQANATILIAADAALAALDAQVADITEPAS